MTTAIVFRGAKDSGAAHVEAGPIFAEGNCVQSGAFVNIPNNIGLIHV